MSCYLIAKSTNGRGCYAYKTNHGPHLAELKQSLRQEVAGRVELITVSRPTAYPEYGPYEFVDDEAEFVRAVIEKK